MITESNALTLQNQTFHSILFHVSGQLSQKLAIPVATLPTGGVGGAGDPRVTGGS